MPRALRVPPGDTLVAPVVALDADVTLCMRMSSGSCPTPPPPPPPPLSADPLATAAAGVTRKPGRARGGKGAARVPPARDDAPDCMRVRSAAASAPPASSELRSAVGPAGGSPLPASRDFLIRLCSHCAKNWDSQLYDLR